MERLVHDWKAKFVADPSEECRDAWLSAQDALTRLTSSTGEQKRFFSKLAFYEGEHTGRVLAKISWAQQASPSIGALRASDGKITNSPDKIMMIPSSFYPDLYCSRQNYRDASLQEYLGRIELPTLSDMDRQQLDAPLTLEEFQTATGMFPNSKAPDEHGIPIEVYKNYGEQLLPKLLGVFNDAKTTGCLPLSMSKAIIVLLLKPGKDVKILAKVLALRLNKSISSIIHSDQAGFMPQKSTLFVC